MLSQLTTLLIQEFINNIYLEKGFSKNFLKNILKILKKYKEEQIQNRKDYGDTYMKHYKKIVNNPYNNKSEIMIINAYAELEVPLEEVKIQLQRNYGSKVKIYNTQIPMAINVAKSTSCGESIFSYDNKIEKTLFIVFSILLKI